MTFLTLNDPNEIPAPIDPPPGDWRLGSAVTVFRLDAAGEIQVLMGRRKGAHGAGTYAFPGGKLDGQGLYTAALRELAEETGLVGVPIAYLGDVYREFEDKDKGLQRWRTLYALVSASGEPRTLEPQKSYGWNWHYLDSLPEPLFAPASEFICAGRLEQAAVAWLERR